MKIQKILKQHRRDFTAIMECEHCGQTDLNRHGYDDAAYHQLVIPAMKCKLCDKTADDSYRPLTTKYAAGELV